MVSRVQWGVQVAGFLEGTLILADEHASQFSHADLFVIDRTNPLDEENEDALKDHAVGHCDGRNGGTLHVKFLVTSDAHAGNTTALERVKRASSALKQPMSRWYASSTLCYNVVLQSLCHTHVACDHLPACQHSVRSYKYEWELMCRWVMRLGNIATLSREWAAVKRAERSPLRDILLSGAARTLPSAQHLQVPRGLLDHLDSNYNASQYKALTAGLDGRPLVLIQGPPGTGKTQYVATASSVTCTLFFLLVRLHAVLGWVAVVCRRVLQWK